MLYVEVFFLHAGNLNGIEMISSIKIDNFSLCLSSAADDGIYVDAFSRVTSNKSNVPICSVRLDVRKLCKDILRGTQKFYDSFNDKSAFELHTFKIVDIQYEMNKIKIMNCKK